MDRKLAAILAADVVGYSAMMERDEAGTHERVRAGRMELLEPTIARHHGTIFKLMGDGLLAEFPSVVEVMECAVSLQRGLAERNASLPQDHRVEMRIGVNLGEVIVDGDDRFGEGVNIAARLEQLAEPGGIWVSAKVAREVEKKLAFGFQPMGPHRVKNIAEPVEAYRVTIDGKALPRRASRDRSRLATIAAIISLIVAITAVAWWQSYGTKRKIDQSGIPTVAVLPFKNMSGEPALEYFSDGMTDNLISMLAGVTELKVLSRSSTFVYKNKPTDVRQIGQELNAAYVIEGSIWKETDRVRISAQLIDAHTGENLWAEKFDRTGNNPLALQDEVIERIIGTLGGQRGKMYDSEYKKVWEKDTPDLEEYDYFLRSNFFFGQFTPESLVKATDIILEGLAKFPDSSLLSCGLAWDHVLAANLAFDNKPKEHWQAASELEAKVLPRANLGPDAKKSCLWSSVYVSAYEGKFDLSLRRSDEVIALSPGDAFLIGDLSQAARFNGLTDKAVERADYGLRNDPNFADYYLMVKANALTDIEQYAESALLIAKTADIQITVPLLRAINDMHLGKTDDAHSEVAKALKMQPWYTAVRWRDMTFHINRAVIDRQVSDLVAAGLPMK
ncbi:adenylate/guanylate cyclase domain-containing protein [Mesorhizobium sp. VK9D]|uniref:adenylate/guanylate cyclase domain-containing protein n=1 Tax=Mesorhizobium australafricanum TaxID=3072311 RepID=UPI002A23A817|nr:adenylate/guanylate cyclase domain-containing protein [Mesorhizobium sp. VK9D]MDX8451152.1 adenylate/guanylate cyclase domain-containing protein [Mesorhizobium sp. VK9D]